MSVMKENKSFGSNHCQIKTLLHFQIMPRSASFSTFLMLDSSRLFISKAIHQQELYPFNNYLSMEAGLEKEIESGYGKTWLNRQKIQRG